ncbi:MAG: PTS IIA-like nitrogen-regulatory protein PtsN [Rhodospirillaceae bacterium]|mgnify:CR=1 FL=1|nr:PTS IIA-like nitrogen-regulatory protein PtsN [Rhodospirillaceae bacterium]|tara:strand:- start:42827 stop:43291 length:465 start_codon:yes stop_codon:yes gene_type:complete
MEIAEILNLSGVIPALKTGSKKHALQGISDVAAKLTGLHERTVFDVLLERERLGSTGVGNGVAIPHGRLSGINQLYAVFAKLDKKIDFESIDEEPVDLIFLLLAPKSAGADHLKALAKVSRLLKNEGICEQLRGSDTAEALYALLTNTPTVSAA